MLKRKKHERKCLTKKNNIIIMKIVLLTPQKTTNISKKNKYKEIEN